jgi:hypothetical protein
MNQGSWGEAYDGFGFACKEFVEGLRDTIKDFSKWAFKKFCSLFVY